MKFFIFSVDLLSRRTHLRTKDLPSTITLNGKLLNLHSATLWGGGHYICMFNYANTWLIYDGLKEQRHINSGLSVFNGQPSEPCSLHRTKQSKAKTKQNKKALVTSDYLTTIVVVISCFTSRLSK